MWFLGRMSVSQLCSRKTRQVYSRCVFVVCSDLGEHWQHSAAGPQRHVDAEAGICYYVITLHGIVFHISDICHEEWLIICLSIRYIWMNIQHQIRNLSRETTKLWQQFYTKHFILQPSWWKRATPLVPWPVLRCHQVSLVCVSCLHACEETLPALSKVSPTGDDDTHPFRECNS